MNLPRFAYRHPVVIPLLASTTLQSYLALRVRCVEYDEAIFLDVARNIIRTGIPLRSIGQQGVFFFDHTPLYVYFLGLLTWLVGERVLLLRLITSVFSVGSVVLVFCIVARLRGRWSACCAALILSMSSYYTVYSFHIRMEVPMCFFVLLASYQIQRWEETRRYRFLLLSGLTLMVAVMLKEIALIQVATSVAYVVWREKRIRLASVLALGLPSALALVMWLLIAWSLSASSTLAVIRRWSGALWASGASEGGRSAVSAVAWLHTLGSDLLGWCLAALSVVALLGLVTGLRRRRHSAVWLYAFHLVGVALATSVIRMKEPRFAITLVPMSGVVVGSVTDWEVAIAWMKRRIGSAAALAVVATGVWGLSPLTMSLGDTSHPLGRWIDPVFAQRALENDSYYAALRQAGSYLNAHTSSDTVISVIHEGPVVAYYADRSYRMLYTLPKAEVLRILRDTQFLVYDHVVFVQLTAGEIQEVLSYIDTHFGIEQEIVNQRRVVVLRRVVVDSVSP